MNVPVNQNDVELALAEQFNSLADSHKDMPMILAEARSAAVAGLIENGLPHRRVEAWKYTDLRSLMRDAYPLADEALAAEVEVNLAETTFANLSGTKIVFVNGVLRKDLSGLEDLPDGVSIGSLASAYASDSNQLLATEPYMSGGNDNAIGYLVSVFAGEGLVLSVDEGVKVVDPIHLIYLNRSAEPFASYRQALISVAAGASLTLLESHVGSVAYQTCGVVGFDLAENAELDHIKHQADSGEAQHLSRARVRLASKAACRSFTLNNGASVSRNETFIEYTGVEAYGHVSGAVLLRDKQHSDTTILVDHAVPDCNSEQTFHYVLNDNSKGVFQGRVIVQPGAHGTDGRQSSKALLVSDRAEMNAKPELEIFNDDVQCAHGSTVGELDEDLLFYLRARGIPLAEARTLLIQAFIGGAVETIRSETVREIIGEAAEAWLKEAY